MRLTLCPLGVLAAALGLSPSTPAHACGGMAFPSHEERVGGMSDQELLVAFTPDQTVLVASAGYRGVDAADFAFILPLGSSPTEVRDADPALFIALDEHAAPRVSVYLEEDEPAPRGCGASKEAPGDFSNGAGDDGEVMVHQRGQTATYEYVVIGGDTGSAVADWLTDEGYPLPADYAAALEPYVSDGRFFFAAKVLPQANDGALAPIELHLPASPPEAFEIPLGLAAHSLVPGEPLGITTYLWADGAVLPDGYPSSAILDGALEALSPDESNYAELEQAILGSDPGGAWIIDRSGLTTRGELESAYEAAIDAGRDGATASKVTYVADFEQRLGLTDGHLTRVRTSLAREQLRDMRLRRSTTTGEAAVDNHHTVTYEEGSQGDDGCAIDRHGRAGTMLLLVPALVLLRRGGRRRRRGRDGAR